MHMVQNIALHNFSIFLIEKKKLSTQKSLVYIASYTLYILFEKYYIYIAPYALIAYKITYITSNSISCIFMQLITWCALEVLFKKCKWNEKRNLTLLWNVALDLKFPLSQYALSFIFVCMKYYFVLYNKII